MTKDIIEIYPAQEGTFCLHVYSPTRVLRGCVVCEDMDEMLSALEGVYADQVQDEEN